MISRSICKCFRIPMARTSALLALPRLHRRCRVRSRRPYRRSSQQRDASPPPAANSAAPTCERGHLRAAGRAGSRVCKDAQRRHARRQLHEHGGRRRSHQTSREKYTLGEVKKLAGNMWLIPARIQYGEHDVTLPITVPIQWAGDTPVIVVDNVGLPGFGTVSARVMFFADHYAGYWKHGEHGGHLFGIIRRDGEAAAAESPGQVKPASSGGDAARWRAGRAVARPAAGGTR